MNSTHLLGQNRVWLVGPYKVLDPEGNLVAMVEESDKDLNVRQEREIKFKTLRVFGPVS